MRKRKETGGRESACQMPQRVLLTDWQGVEMVKMVGSQARSVVGGICIKMLADLQVWQKFRP